MPTYHYGEHLIDLSNPNLVTTKIISRVPHGARVLELGCNNGYMSQEFQKKDCAVIGIEFDRGAIEKAKPFCEQTICADLNVWDAKAIPPESLDTIVAADVLEHLLEPRELLEKLHSALKPDGRVIASIPNITHSSLALALLKGQFNYRPEGLLDDSHFRFFSEQSIYYLFESAGFYVESMDRVFAAVGTTEFDRFEPPVSGAIIEFTKQHKDACTYQFVVVARPCSERQAITKLSDRVQALELEDVEKLKSHLVGLQKERDKLQNENARLSNLYQKTWQDGCFLLKGKLGKVLGKLRVALLAQKPLLGMIYRRARAFHLYIPRFRVARRLKNIVGRFFPRARLLSTPTYDPASWGSSPTAFSQSLFLVGKPDAASFGVPLVNSLGQRGLKIYGQSVTDQEALDALPVDFLRISASEIAATAGVLECGAFLLFDLLSFERFLSSQWTGGHLPILIVLDDPSPQSLERIAALMVRYPKTEIGVLAFSTSEALSGEGRNFRMRSFDVSKMSPQHRHAFLAARLEEFLIDLRQPEDPVLNLSGKHSLPAEPYAVRAPLISEVSLPAAKDLTVVIPTLNAGFEFKSTLESIRSQRIYGESEIIVVDSGSTDGTVALAESFGAKVLAVDKKDFNHGLTRDFVVGEAQSELVCCMVQDAVLQDPESLANLTRHFRDEAVAGAYTCSRPVQGHDLFASFEVNLHRTYLGSYAKQFSIKSRKHFESLDYASRLQFCRYDNTCSVLRKEVWRKAPFGKVKFGEDIAWAKQALLLGFKTVYDPFARIVHSHMRPAEYSLKRGMVQSVCVPEILGLPEATYPELSVEELDLCASRIEALKKEALYTLRANEVKGQVKVSEARLALKHLHGRVTNLSQGVHSSLIHFLLRIPSALGAILYDLSGEEELSLEAYKGLVERVAAGVQGALYGDYYSSAQYQGFGVPTKLQERYEELGRGV